MHKSFCPLIRPGHAAACWILGLLAGAVCASGADAAVLSLMRLSLFGRVSIVRLFLWAFVPFLITAAAVKINCIRLLPPVLYVRSFVTGYFLWLCVLSFGTACWAVYPLLMFTDLFSGALLCASVLLFPSQWMGRTFAVCFFALCFIGAVVIFDLWAVAPFLESLSDSF